MTNQEIAAEMKTLICKFNKGIKSVEIDNTGKMTVLTKSHKGATGVTVDLLRSRAFANVHASIAPCGTMYQVEATPKQLVQ